MEVGRGDTSCVSTGKVIIQWIRNYIKESDVELYLGIIG